MTKPIPVPQFTSIILGPLPHEMVATALGTIVAEGVVQFTASAQMHAFKEHAHDFMICQPYLAQAIAVPTYIGQRPHHKAKGFEHVLRVSHAGIFVLVAITLRPSNGGVYFVKSVYPIGQATVLNRVGKGFLTEL